MLNIIKMRLKVTGHLLTFLLLIGVVLNLSAQSELLEKRLALVIGNADYEVGPLSNPVNDAILIANAFDSLGFDVILDTNIRDKASFEKTIRLFDSRRRDYDVGFVYYAGHGIQVGSENFMIPTKANLESEEDVFYYGVSVQMIVRILTRTTDQVNVLILDACRNNPFESNWNSNRSLSGSKGLAKMQAPMGSLIAFSTTAGNVAPDGNDSNSFYCTALVKNMFKERTSLDQLFRNVRAEVLERTDGLQQTEESTQLTGETFYLVQSNFNQVYDKVDSLINIDEYVSALELAQSILQEAPENYTALYQRAQIYFYLDKNNTALQGYKELQELYPSEIGPYFAEAFIHYFLGNYQEAIRKFRICLSMDELDYDFYDLLGDCFDYTNQHDSAIAILTKAIDVFPNVDSIYSRRQYMYLQNGDTLNAINDLKTILKINPSNWHAILDLADLYTWIDSVGTEKPVELYQRVISSCTKFDPLIRAINNHALIYEKEGNLQKAIDDYTLIIDRYRNTPDVNIALTIRNRARLLELIGNYERAAEDYILAIEKDSSEVLGYSYLADFYMEKLGDTISALPLYAKIIDLEPSPQNYTSRAALYLNMERYSLAQKDLSKVITQRRNEYDYWNWYGEFLNVLVFYYQEDYTKVIAESKRILKVIDYEQFDVDRFHSLLAWAYQNQGEYQLAEESFQNAIAINQDQTNITELLNFYWETNDTAGFQLYERYLDSLQISNSQFIPVLENILSIKMDWRNYEDALVISQKLIHLDSTSENFSNHGLLLFNLGKVTESFLALEKAIMIDSNNTSPLFLRSKVYQDIGQDKDAVRDLMKVINVDPNDPEGYYYLALYYQEQKMMFKALRYFDEAIINYTDGYYITDHTGNQNVPLHEVYVTRAKLYKQLGEYELMCEDLKEAVFLGADISSIQDCNQ